MWNCSAMNIVGMMRQTVKTNRILHPIGRYFFWWSLQLFCAQKVQRFTIHRTYVSLLWALVNQSKVLLILMVQATNLASIIDWFPGLIIPLGHRGDSITYTWINDGLFVNALNTSENQWMISQPQKELDHTWIPVVHRWSDPMQSLLFMGHYRAIIILLMHMCDTLPSPTLHSI